MTTTAPPSWIAEAIYISEVSLDWYGGFRGFIVGVLMFFSLVAYPYAYDDTWSYLLYKSGHAILWCVGVAIAVYFCEQSMDLPSLSSKDFPGGFPSLGGELKDSVLRL